MVSLSRFQLKQADISQKIELLYLYSIFSPLKKKQHLKNDLYHAK